MQTKGKNNTLDNLTKNKHYTLLLISASSVYKTG